MKQSIFYSVFIIVFLLFACNKTDNNVSKTALLTSGSWKLTAVVSDNDADGTYETDDYAGFPDCYKDNFYIFHTNGVLEMNEGPFMCDPTDPQTETTNWQLINNDANLMIWNDTWEVLELTNTTLKWKEAYPGGRSSLVTFTKR